MPRKRSTDIDIDPETGAWRWWTSPDKKGPRLARATYQGLTALRVSHLTGPALRAAFTADLTPGVDPISDRTATNLIGNLRKYGAITSEEVPGTRTKLYRLGPKGTEVLSYLP